MDGLFYTGSFSDMFRFVKQIIITSYGYYCSRILSYIKKVRANIIIVQTKKRKYNLAIKTLKIKLTTLQFYNYLPRMLFKKI